MDATIPTVIGTGLTAIGTGVALFAALWRAQGTASTRRKRRRRGAPPPPGRGQGPVGTRVAFIRVARRRAAPAGTGDRLEGMTTMDATILTVIGTGIALFAALWKVQGNRFDTAEKLNRERFDMAEKLNRERFETMDRRWVERFDMAENANRERFDLAEKASRERFDLAERASRERLEAMDARWTERFETIDRRFEAMDRRWAERFETVEERFETAERQNEAAHAAICKSIARLDERTRADAAALHQRFDGLNGRFDDLYRHLLGERAKTDVPGHAPAAE